MQSESDREHELQQSDLQNGVQPDLIVCSNCEVEIPKMLFCPNCGYPQHFEDSEQNDLEQIDNFGIEKTSESLKLNGLNEGIVEAESSQYEETNISEKLNEMEKEIDSGNENGKKGLKTDSFFSFARRYFFGRESKPSKVEYGEDIPDFSEEESVHREEISKNVLEEIKPIETNSIYDHARDTKLPMDIDIQNIGEGKETPSFYEDISQYTMLEPDFEPDPIMKDVQDKIMKNTSLKLWSIELLLKGDVKEDQFKLMFEEYDRKSEFYMNQRSGILKRAYNLGPFKKSLNEAKIFLAELKMKNKIGDISDKEYQIKSSFFQWDINHNEKEIAKRKAEIEFLENPTRIISKEELNLMKEKAVNYQQSLDSPEISLNINSEILVSIKKSLDGTLRLFETFKHV